MLANSFSWKSLTAPTQRQKQTCWILPTQSPGGTSTRYRIHSFSESFHRMGVDNFFLGLSWSFLLICFLFTIVFRQVSFLRNNTTSLIIMYLRLLFFSCSLQRKTIFFLDICLTHLSSLCQFVPTVPT
jgi:hypothetical protein